MSTIPKKTRKSDNRSRNGCTTCKKRRIKCDETHPKCIRCSRRNLECNYQQSFLWQDDALNQGISFGRSKASRRLAKQRKGDPDSDNNLELTLSEMCALNDVWLNTKNECMFVNVVEEDFKPEWKLWKSSVSNRTLSFNKIVEIYETDETEPGILDVSTSPQLQLVHLNTGSPLGFLDLDFADIIGPSSYIPTVTLGFDLIHDVNYEKEFHAFDFMVKRIFPNCICYGDENHTWDENPYLKYIVPLSTKSNLVFKALVSYGAKVYSILNKSPEFALLSDKYREEVMKELPEQINLKRIFNSNDWEEIFGTILLLCSSNISSDCDLQWIVHTEGGKKLINSISSSDDVQSLDPFKKFFVRYLTSHEIMWETIKPNETENKYPNFESYKNEHDNNIDMILGCSPNLIRIINEITKLGKYYESIELESPQNKPVLEKLILSRKNSLLEQVDSLRQVVDKKDNNLLGIKLLAEIKRLTTKIYLLARIDFIEIKYNLNGQIPKTKISELNGLIKQIIEQMKLIDCISMSLIWPFFVIGMVGIDLNEETRWFILSKFKEMENLRNLASLRLARCTIESVWKHRDLHSSKFLTWKELIAFNNETISLA